MKNHLFMIVSCVVCAMLVFSSGYPAVSEDLDSVSGQVAPKEVKVDRDYDGRVDLVEKYGKDGNILERLLDSTGDGVMDDIVYFKDGKPVKAERDADNDGTPESTTLYDEEGLPVKVESDTTGDGKIDEWTFFEKGEPKRVERDTNSDGKADTWIDY